MNYVALRQIKETCLVVWFMFSKGQATSAVNLPALKFRIRITLLSPAKRWGQNKKINKLKTQFNIKTATQINTLQDI